MKRVTGIGGIFFKTRDPAKTREWYARHLGFNVDDYGTNFRGADGFALWSPFPADSDYFEAPVMINYRVENLEELLEVLREEGVEQVGEVQNFDYGKFAHIRDVEGNKVELWEPVHDEYERMIGNAKTP